MPPWLGLRTLWHLLCARRDEPSMHSQHGRMPALCPICAPALLHPAATPCAPSHPSPPPAGAIRYAGARFRAISKFALVVLRERNPTRQSCDGWKEVAWNGEKLDVLR